MSGICLPESLAFDPERLTGFRQEQLASVFDRVRDPYDWKAPIAAEIAAADRVAVERAVHWFTDTVPVFLAVPGESGRLVVMARGYRLGPSGT
jgi:hypothetical protein